MNSVTNKTRLSEKRYRDKINKDKEEIRLNTIKKNEKQLEKLKKTITIIIINCKKKQKRLQNYKRKSNMK